MKFRNTTPFPALAYTMVDVERREHHVVVLRQTFDLVRSPASGRSLDVFEARAVVQDAPPLLMEDRYAGDIGESSVLEESDLAPFKPRCDLVVNADAHAPGGQPSRRWDVRLRAWSAMLEAHQARGTGRAAGKPALLLDKRLAVCGPRSIRHGLLGWGMGEPKPARVVPIDYEHAFGGSARVRNPRHADDGNQPEFLLNQACYSNPIGCGWIDGRLPAALSRAGLPAVGTLPAPQVEYPDARLASPVVLKPPEAPHSPADMARLVAGTPGRTAGLGCLGRAWTPRIQKAGSYDAAWLDQHWPHLPSDFDFGYWNAAPPDQQIAHPPPDIEVELLNLVDPGHAPSGCARFTLPGHRVFALLRPPRAQALPLPFRIDTVVVDARAMRVSVVWRFSLPKTQPVASLAVGFEPDPGASLPFPRPPLPHTQGAPVP